MPTNWGDVTSLNDINSTATATGMPQWLNVIMDPLGIGGARTNPKDTTTPESAAEQQQAALMQKIQDFLSQLMKPPDPNDPMWQSIQATVQARATQTAAMFGATGGGTAGFVDQALAGEMSQFEQNRLGLGVGAASAATSLAGLQGSQIQQAWQNQMTMYAAQLQQRQGLLGGALGAVGGIFGGLYGGPTGAKAGGTLGYGLGTGLASQGAGAPPPAPTFGSTTPPPSTTGF